MKIYWLLFYSRPQVIQNLDDYQLKEFGCHIEVPLEPKGSYTVEGIEEIDKLIRQVRSRDAGLSYS